MLLLLELRLLGMTEPTIHPRSRGEQFSGDDEFGEGEGL